MFVSVTLVGTRAYDGSFDTGYGSIPFWVFSVLVLFLDVVIFVHRMRWGFIEGASSSGWESASASSASDWSSSSSSWSSSSGDSSSSSSSDFSGGGGSSGGGGASDSY